MLATKLKEKEKLLGSLRPDSLFLVCSGCREVCFPEDEINLFIAEAAAGRAIRLDYLCREEFCRACVLKHADSFSRAGSIIVFSCGVGVQAMAKTLVEKAIIPGCDTFHLSGHQGLRAQRRDCEQCGECRLSETGAICPLTACSKSLLNGPCGGANNGKCEVNGEMDCGWELIYKRLKEQSAELVPGGRAETRDYQKLITGGK